MVWTEREDVDATFQGQRRVRWRVYRRIFTGRCLVAIYVAAAIGRTDESAVDTGAFSAGYGAVSPIANI